jgi:hypothetical protein
MSAHDHAHDHHHHDDGDTYFLDQSCMIGISGAFGAICLAMYIMNLMTPADGQSMLGLLLGPQFHLFVLGSGIALVAISLVRAVTLWRQAGSPVHAHNHDHAHDHDHHHDHERAHDPGHDHHHDHDHHDCCGHEHAVQPESHLHAHGDHHHHHDHAHHDHDAADHDHGWAPWRYVLLLVPIILFLLGLPNKGPQAAPVRVNLDLTNEAAVYAGMIASAPTNAEGVPGWLAVLYLGTGEVQDVQFKDLESYASSEESRSQWQGKTIRVRGQYAPSPGSDHFFSLVRFRIQCCGADAIPLRIPMVTRDKLSDRSELKLNQWVKVTGVVDFQQDRGRYITVVRALNNRAIEACNPDSNPYIQ